MLLSLMVYVITVSLLLALAAWAFERAVRVFAFPTRWIWVGAMAGSVGYTLVAGLRPTAFSRPLGTVVATPLDALLVPLVGSIMRVADASPSGIGLDTLLGAVWVVLTLAVATVLLRAQLRLRSDRSTWTPAELDGRDVLVSEDLGPGVVGWIRSVIVMPRWAFRMPPQERELMLQHEGEHCNAGDTRVAGLALLFLTLLPWNLPLWWQVHRLRLAIEIDCDHRVLHRSADVKRYARLLVEIGARGPAARLSALAFARPIPSIERRILAMTDTRDPRYVRMAGLILLSALLVVVSCEVERPPTGVPEASVVPADPPVVRVEPPTTQGEPAASGVESIEDAIRTLRALDPAGGPIVRGTDQAGDVAPSQAEPQEISPEDRTAIQSGPSLMPMTIRPEIRNRTEVQGALMREYPVTLRDSGIGGTVVLWLYLSDEGVVLDRRLSRSSGQAQLDEAALRVATTLRFTPAVRRTEPVAVWIEVPITFQVR